MDILNKLKLAWSWSVWHNKKELISMTPSLPLQNGFHLKSHCHACHQRLQSTTTRCQQRLSIWRTEWRALHKKFSRTSFSNYQQCMSTAKKPLWSAASLSPMENQTFLISNRIWLPPIKSWFSLFTKCTATFFIALFVYIDDIILMSSDTTSGNVVKDFLATKFRIKALNSLKYFLDMEVKRSKFEIQLCQRKCALDIL